MFREKADKPLSDNECGPSTFESKGAGLINMLGIVLQSHVAPAGV